MAAKNNVAGASVDAKTPNEMARLLCISESDLRRLTLAGILQRSTKNINGRQRVVYPLEENVMRYIGHINAPVQRLRDEYQQEKKMTQRIVREQKELELAIARGDMIRRAHVVLVMTGYFSTIRNHVLAVPARCARQVLGKKDLHAVRAILDKACRDCLRESADFGAHSFDEPSKNGKHAQGAGTFAARVKRRRRRDPA